MENGKYWYARTPERDAEFLRRFPQAKVGNGRLFSSIDGWSGNTINFTVKGDSVEVSPDGDTRDTTEFKPDVFPERYWFVNTPENVAEFKKRFPATKFMYGESMDTFFEKRRDQCAFTYSMLVGGALAFCHSNPPQRTRFYFDNEKTKLDSAKVAEVFPPGYWLKNTKENVAEFLRRFPNETTSYGPGAITHYRPVKDEASTSPAPQPGNPKGVKENSPFLESPLAVSCLASGFRAPYLSWSSGGVPVSVSSSKESSMSISDSDVQRIAAAVIKMQSPATSSESTGPGIARRAGSFAWGATKGALGWAFAPAAKWAQTVVFLSAVVGLLLGSYKAYNTVRSIQLPSIVWPESSPSDVVSQPAPTESLTSWLNEQSGT